MSMSMLNSKSTRLRPGSNILTPTHRLLSGAGGAAPTASAADLLAGLDIWTSEDNWSLLEDPFQIAGGGLDMEAAGESGTKVARWKPTVSPLANSTDYTVRITFIAAAGSASGALISLHGSTSTGITHTSGTADYAITSGTSTTNYMIEFRFNVANFNTAIVKAEIFAA